MDAKRTSEVAIAGLVFALLSFVTVTVVTVYVYTYKEPTAAPAPVPSSFARSMYSHQMPMQSHMASPMTMTQKAPMTHHAQVSQPMMPQQPTMNVPPVQQLTAANPAPPIPRTIASGVVGSFFDDELPQA